MENSKLKNCIYSFIHIISNIFTPKFRESRRFFLFFTAASVFELALSNLVLYLAQNGLYDLHTAYRIAPVMTESAIVSLLLALVAAVILDFNINTES